MKRVIVIVIGVILVAGISFYALSPLWNAVEIDEALPESSNESTVSGDTKMEMMEARRAPVVPTNLHPAKGEVLIVVADGKKYIRYENYQTINGPDLFVYLSKDLEGKDFVDIGPVKATEGNINYEIPSGVNPEDYKYVLTWCKKFGVLFNSAEINPEN